MQSNLLKEIKILEKENIELKNSASLKETLYQESKEKLTLQLEKISNTILEKHSKEFLQTSKLEITNLISPFQTNLELLKTAIEVTKDQSENKLISLNEHIKAILDKTPKLTHTLEGNHKKGM